MSVPVLPDLTFIVFLVSWLVTRQILFLFVLLSVYYDAGRIIPNVWDPSSGAYITRESLRFYWITLGALLVLMCLWFYMIARVAYDVVKGNPAEDVRSDDEE